MLAAYVLWDSLIGLGPPHAAGMGPCSYHWQLAHSDQTTKKQSTNIDLPPKNKNISSYKQLLIQCFHLSLRFSNMKTSGPVPVRGYTPLFFKLSDRVIDSKKDLVNVSLNCRKFRTYLFPKVCYWFTFAKNDWWMCRRCWTSTYLQRAPLNKPTHRSRLFIFISEFTLNWIVDELFHIQVYFVTVDKKSKAVSLSHAKDNKVVIYKFAFSVSSF